MIIVANLFVLISLAAFIPINIEGNTLNIIIRGCPIGFLKNNPNKNTNKTIAIPIINLYNDKSLEILNNLIYQNKGVNTYYERRL